MSETREHAIGDVLRSFAGDGQHTPDVELRAEVEENGDQDGEAEARAQLIGENGGLGKEAGADGARSE